MQFEKFADSYDANAWIQQDLINWGLPHIASASLKNKSILEFGAGTGLLTQHLAAQQPAKLLATDASPKMIKLGKQNVPEAHWQLLNAWSPPQIPCDHIFSSSLLHWALNPEDVLRKWKALLPKSGTIHALFFIDKTLIELESCNASRGAIHWRSFEDWKSIFTNVGLQIELSRAAIKQYSFPCALDLLRMLKLSGTTGSTKLSGAELRRTLRTYDEAYKVPEGVTSTWHFCQIVVRK